MDCWTPAPVEKTFNVVLMKLFGASAGVTLVFVTAEDNIWIG